MNTATAICTAYETGARPWSHSLDKAIAEGVVFNKSFDADYTWFEFADKSVACFDTVVCKIYTYNKKPKNQKSNKAIKNMPYLISILEKEMPANFLLKPLFKKVQTVQPTVFKYTANFENLNKAFQAVEALKNAGAKTIAFQDASLNRCHIFRVLENGE